MKKLLKISLWTLGVVLTLLFCAFAVGWFYLKQHRKQAISFIEMEAKKNLNGGTLHIGDIDIGFKHTFPRLAFTIDTLHLRDSLWNQHHHDLISATRVYATLDLFKLIIGKISIDRVALENPQIYLYSDSQGYKNTSMFKKSNGKNKGIEKTPSYPDFLITDGRLTIDEGDAHKLFGFDINSLHCRIQGEGETPGVTADLELDCLVQGLTFNSDNGPFLEKKSVAGNFQIHFNLDSKVLQFEKIKLAVDQHPFLFTGKFFLAEVPAPFLLSWETDNLSFRKAASFLSKNIRLKLDPYDISESIAHLTGSLDNSEPEYHTPLVRLRLKVINKTITTPIVVIPHASFTASFINEEIKGRGHEDSNTVMHFSQLKGQLDQLHFNCDSLVIRNLNHPRMYLHILSHFELENINNFLNENELAFLKGTGNIDLVYNGSMEKEYDSLRMINGIFNIDSATLQYVPRSLLFTKGKGLIRFTGKDMVVDNLNLYSGGSDLIMNGTLKSIFYLINQKNKKLALDWSIRSNKLNLNDFTPYLKRKQVSSAPKKKKSSLAQTLTEFTTLLETADFNLNLSAKQVNYEKFSGNNLQATMIMNDNFISLREIRIRCAEGDIRLQGEVRNEVASNPFSIKARMENVNVSRIFYAFNNFGLKSPTDKNLGGALTADITLQGGLTTQAQIIPAELRGFVKFNLENGQLVNFEPLQKIQETVFKKRNFSDIQFADLHDLLEINGEDVTVNRMEIRSTVLHMFVEGRYNMKSGPDLSIQVPLSNLTKSQDAELANKGINSKTGISARLRAQRGEDGKIKISWDPFNKAAKPLNKTSQKPKS